ncbi:MAG TPA: serine/threonine-protein kinase [Gemmatimonadaceae bacterium]
MSTPRICPQCGTEYGPEQRFCPTDGTPLRAQSPHDSLVGQVIADRYLVTGLLGEGGMGRVYAAEHVRMGRRSALKVMSPSLATTADAITRFNREAANAAQINHPNVAAIYDFGETPDGLLYIAMEFVEGETLRALIERSGPLPIARAAQITRGVADALHAAHHLGIIHRDLKPDNIMLARQLDGADWVKVVDFGIAKSVASAGEGRGGQTVTTAGVSLGTPEYMSPEQLAGEKLDPRTDIYSLGLVLFNMLTGQLPYPKLTSKETLVRRLTSAPATLSDVRPDVTWPAPVQAVLSRALDPEPDRRYANVADFGRAISAAAVAEGDADATVRLPAAARPSAAAPVAKAPAAAAAPASKSPTRKLPPDPPPQRGSSRILFAAAVLLVVVIASFFAMHGRRPADAAPVAVRPPADSTPAPADSASAAIRKPDSAATRPDSSPPKADTPVVKHRRPQAAPATPQPAVSNAASTPPATPPTPAPVEPRAPIASTAPDTIAAALQEVRNHLQRGGREVAGGRMLAANREMRLAQTELKNLRQQMPAGALTPEFQRQVRGLAAASVQACFNAAAGEPQASQRCRLLQERETRAARGGRGIRPPNP